MARITIPLPDHFVFATDIPVRISDINYGNHVGNDAILSLLHEARMQFLAQWGYDEADVEGVGMLMVDAALQYTAQSRYGDRLHIELCTADWRRTGFDLLYRITHADTGHEITRAKTGMCFFDYSAGNVARAPQGIQAKFERPGPAGSTSQPTN